MLTAFIMDGKDCNSDASGNIFCDCTDDDDPSYPTAYIGVGTSGQVLEMKPENYFDYYAGYGCWYLVASELSSTVDYWILGDNFLRGYYQIYDMANLQVGMFSSGFIRNGSYSGAIYTDDTPSQGSLSLAEEDDKTDVYIVVGVICGVLFLVLLGIGIRFAYKENQRKKLEQETNAA
mmetsp:Transcript_11290/g.11327  ORF Transcript_11290/g.11327 Transcript_11290/m.11327 type:complete len:177 (+) Transcript_11290:826-1356(+)